MNTLDTLLVCRTAAHGQQSFILACDDKNLRRLAESLRQRKPLTIRDGDCAIVIEPAPDKTPASLIERAPGLFRWRLPASEARRYADLLAAMAKFSGPCHHYLTAGLNLPPIRVSKGE
jgi:hypothetical protein